MLEQSEGRTEEIWLSYLSEMKEEIFPALTAAEQDVFNALLLDITRDEIALKLGVSVSTVKTRKKSIEAKVHAVLNAA